jgi:hypothetical protein
MPGSRSRHGAELVMPEAGERAVPARGQAYLPFFSPSVTGFAAPELAVANTLGFSCFGFFASLFPRLLSPFPITSSQGDYPARRHAGRTDLRKIMVA